MFKHPLTRNGWFGKKKGGGTVQTLRVVKIVWGSRTMHVEEGKTAGGNISDLPYSDTQGGWGRRPL